MYEAKLNYINVTKLGIEIAASLYQTSLPITDADGKVHYDRTLIARDTRTVSLGTTRTQIMNAVKAKMQEVNQARSLGFIAGDYYVNFQNIGIQ